MDIDLFAKYNRKNIQDRQTDTLIGLSKGLLADGSVNQKEAEYLHNWLLQNRHTSDNPMIQNLFEKIDLMLEDGVLDDGESHELLALLGSLTGESVATGEVPKTTSLPIDLPPPSINFNDSTFMFTGTFVFGNVGLTCRLFNFSRIKSDFINIVLLIGPQIQKCLIAA